MAEIPFEYLVLALETTPGTAITAPTHYFNLDGMITPKKSRWRPPESTGTLDEAHRSVVVRKWSELSGKGPLDPDVLPVLANLALKGGVTAPSTPVGATLARLWEFVPTRTADNLKSATAWWGDPNVQVFRAAYLKLTELKITSNASAEDGAGIEISGTGHFPTRVADPVLPTRIRGPLIAGSAMQVWIDTDDPIGTTEITGRVVSAEHKLPTGVTFKYLGGGPSTTRSFTRTGRARHSAETVVVFEVPDTAQYLQWEDDNAVVKVRVRHNGPAIEEGFYAYVEVDTYGTIDVVDWGELEGSNRTIKLTIKSEFDDTLGAGWRLAVQNARTTL